MSDKKFQRFEKYLILDHLVDGGMAKICRALQLGEQANKIIAVKMVQPQFSNDEAFTRMFQDEHRITIGMVHPNIMQVYDYGKTNGQLYSAMEYIHGANLKQYLDRLKEKKVVFPIDTTCYIISQVCQGLHYAHTFTDKLTGKPFNIVHRDISPHNIMLTYDGTVKVIDFGIAKANTNSEATQTGTIKGKLSYLAPEYLDGLELDARYDQFAVGITLWEMLCSRKLFQANNDLAVLKQIQACKIIPPSEINPTVPKELDEIVMKALSKDRAHRYENLDKMNRALVKFLYSWNDEFNGTDLQKFAYDLFKSEIERDQAKFVEYGNIDTQQYIEEMKNEEKGGKSTKKEASARPTASKEPKEPQREKIREIELSIEPMEGLEIGLNRPGLKNSATKDKTGTKKLNKHDLQVAKSTSRNNKLNSSSSIKTPVRDRTSSKVLSRKEMQNRAEEEEKSVPASLVIIIIAASLCGFAYFNSDFVNDMTGFNMRAMMGEETAERSISSEPKMKKNRADIPTPGSENKGKIILGGVDISMEVHVNGVKTDYLGTPLRVDLGQEITVTVKKPGYIPYISKVTLSKDENSRVINVPELEKAKMGLLTTSQNYTAGSKLVYEEAGELMERELPFKDTEIPEGTYQAKVVNPILGTEKRVEFTIEENKKHFLE